VSDSHCSRAALTLHFLLSCFTTGAACEMKLRWQNQAAVEHVEGLQAEHDKMRRSQQQRRALLILNVQHPLHAPCENT
jgi:hypothetical protein